MTTDRDQLPVDQSARARVLETNESFLVQAPAGSGKTQLLTRRLLKLLAEVDEPEQILAMGPDDLGPHRALSKPRRIDSAHDSLTKGNVLPGPFGSPVANSVPGLVPC